ncbi:DUF6686 family protein [Sphingobacterium humi]|uniref:Uncharacterized protein n=1 Tax=Sphingobacterium humi TaxID=1796905 RepID=A0A6N8KXE1_9SPHI|nr:DUF6686 family protein [Sphingobacterium humi]MVZ61756.1 hypothetical protein [Sphingobacterium humi]
MACNRPTILSRNELGFISMPNGNKLIHLCFNNLHINFSINEFLAFRNIVKDLVYEDCRIPFPDGTLRVLLNTPYEGLNFSFNKIELNQLVTVLDEAYYMRIIYSYMNE